MSRNTDGFSRFTDSERDTLERALLTHRDKLKTVIARTTDDKRLSASSKLARVYALTGSLNQVRSLLGEVRGE